MKDKAMVGPGDVPKGNQGALRTFALGYPGAYEEFPWGERVVKVKGKVFVFLGRDEGGLSVSVKLPQSRLMALGLPFATPTGYGLGKSGWVSVQIGPREKPPMDLMRAWIDESYRAVAPKKLIATLPGEEAAPITKTKKSPARPGTPGRIKQGQARTRTRPR
jgi:predicted DNA-binding protein (MmcQ/YjbR family)